MASKLHPGPATSRESALRSGSPQSGAGAGLAVPVESRAGLRSPHALTPSAVREHPRGLDQLRSQLHDQCDLWLCRLTASTGFERAFSNLARILHADQGLNWFRARATESQKLEPCLRTALLGGQTLSHCFHTRKSLLHSA